MAAGDHTVTGTMTANKVAVADTVVVANLNADQVDGADKDIDGTLAGNSDASVPTEKAVKTYVDAHKNTETAGVHGSASAATASKLMHRDASGRSKVAAPAAADDIARKDTVDTHTALTAAGTHGSTVAATANKLIHRDASGRAQVAAPAAAADIARKDNVDNLAGAGRTTETVKANRDTLIAGVLNTYLKGQGAGVGPVFAKLALGDTGVKIGNNTRSTTGAQVITGVGFQPSVVIFFAIDDTAGNLNISWGFDDGTVHMHVRLDGNGATVILRTTHSIEIQRDLSNYIKGNITALSSDGFTITWTLVGASVADYIYLALP